MDRIGIGIIGLGRGFVLTLPAIRADSRLRIAGAVDLRPTALEAFAREFGVPGHPDLDALLAMPSVDAVYIATPHELHAAQAIAALAAGKHVLVEKPMAITLADGAAMTAAAQAAGRALVVGPSHGFDAPVVRAAEMIASGQFGAVRMVTALNYTDFLYRPRRPEELDRARGGGVVFSQATHQIDVVRRLVGQPVASVRAVTGDWDAERPSDGAYAALMTFEGGAVATLTYSGYGRYDSDELVGWVSELGRTKNPDAYGDARRALAGTSALDEAAAKVARTYGSAPAPAAEPLHNEHFGYVLVSCERADLRITPAGIWVYGDEAREFVPLAPSERPRSEVIDEFVAAILGERAPVHDGAWGLQTMACCAALIESSFMGRDVAPRDLL